MYYQKLSLSLSLSTVEVPAGYTNKNSTKRPLGRGEPETHKGLNPGAISALGSTPNEFLVLQTRYCKVLEILTCVVLIILLQYINQSINARHSFSEKTEVGFKNSVNIRCSQHDYFSRAFFIDFFCHCRQVFSFASQNFALTSRTWASRALPCKAL